MRCPYLPLPAGSFPNGQRIVVCLDHIDQCRELSLFGRAFGATFQRVGSIILRGASLLSASDVVRDPMAM